MLRIAINRCLFLVLAVVVWILAVLMGGCVSAGQPRNIECKGKGVVIVDGAVGPYAGTSKLQADCGDGFTFRSGKPARTVPGKNAPALEVVK